MLQLRFCIDSFFHFSSQRIVVVLVSFVFISVQKGCLRAERVQLLNALNTCVWNVSQFLRTNAIILSNLNLLSLMQCIRHRRKKRTRAHILTLIHTTQQQQNKTNIIKTIGEYKLKWRQNKYFYVCVCVLETSKNKKHCPRSNDRASERVSVRICVHSMNSFLASPNTFELVNRMPIVRNNGVWLNQAARPKAVQLIPIQMI